MMSTVVELRQSVVDRLRTAIDFLTREYPDTPLTVARVCKVARVNRGNVYFSHPEIVEEILESRRRSAKLSPKRPTEDIQKELRSRVRTLDLEKKALLYMFVEQNLKIQDLNRQLLDKDIKLNRKLKKRR